LLDDHVVDLLLDSAAMGMNIVEREGISFSHPARFILVGTMNPEEGDLRPQLTDRFALSVEIQGIRDARERVAIMERNLAFESDAEGFREEWLPREQELSHQIEQARLMVNQIHYTRRDLLAIAALTSSLNVEGHRADLVILKAARAHAAYAGQRAITDRDITLAAELALPHRIKQGPFQQNEISPEELQERIQELQGASSAGEPEPIEEESLEESHEKKKALSHEISEDQTGQTPSEPAPQSIFDQGNAFWWDGGEKTKVGETFSPRKFDTTLDRLSRRRGGRRSRTLSSRKRGRYIQARPASGETDDLAFDATLRAAAPFQQERVEQRKKVAFAIRPSDFQRKIRVKKTANLVLFVVDASWSMAVAERMSATKGAILSLLTDAYQRRDRVGLVVFQKDRATLVLPPTNSVQLARRALADIPVGGKTPLSAGLLLTHQIIQRERILHPDVLPLVILLTDGAGNVSISSLPPQEEAHRLAERIASEDTQHRHQEEAHRLAERIASDEIRSIVINMEHAAFDQGLAQALAQHLEGPCFTLHELKAETLYHKVREEMDGGRGL
jgi:magnesium chelatase subunit D